MTHLLHIIYRNVKNKKHNMLCFFGGDDGSCTHVLNWNEFIHYMLSQWLYSLRLTHIDTQSRLFPFLKTLVGKFQHFVDRILTSNSVLSVQNRLTARWTMQRKQVCFRLRLFKFECTNTCFARCRSACVSKQSNPVETISSP